MPQQRCSGLWRRWPRQLGRHPFGTRPGPRSLSQPHAQFAAPGGINSQGTANDCRELGRFFHDVNAAANRRTTAVAGVVGDWSRVVIESVTPEVDDGRFPAKRILGDAVTVEADVFVDGPDRISCAVRY